MASGPGYEATSGHCWSVGACTLCREVQRKEPAGEGEEDVDAPRNKRPKLDSQLVTVKEVNSQTGPDKSH